MSTEWTKRERIEAIFNREKPDRIPVYDLMFNDAAIEYYSGKKLEYGNGYQVTCEAISNCLDMTRNVLGPQRIREEKDERGFVFHFERWTSWMIKRPFTNDEELINFIKDDIDQLSSLRFDSDYLSDYIKKVEYNQSLLKGTVNLYITPTTAVNYANYYIGMENLGVLIYDEPELLSEWFKAIRQSELRRIDAIADRRISPVDIIYADVAQKDRLSFSPEFLRRELIPDVRDLCDLFHSKGMKVIFHSDGNIMSILDDLNDAGVDGLNPLEIAAGMDIKEIKERFGRNFIICGGIDVSKLMPYGTKDEVITATKELINIAGKDYGLCLGSSTELGNDIPLENVRAMIETCWEYGKY